MDDSYVYTTEFELPSVYSREEIIERVEFKLKKHFGKVDFYYNISVEELSYNVIFKVEVFAEHLPPGTPGRKGGR